MICDTCAPESENVTTERGCRIISSTWSWFSLASGWTKKQLEVALQRQVDHGLDGVDAALARDLGDRAVRAGRDRSMRKIQS